MIDSIPASPPCAALLKRPDISRLDPACDAREIVFVLGAWDFPWDIERALEFALFRTYAIPSISSLLARTGEFKNRTRKRYDDTELILAEIMEHGADHSRGASALARMNEMHARYKIANDDFLYVLSTFIYEPIRWLDRFGWRRLTEQERDAFYHYYADLGRRMGIHDTPPDRALFERFNCEYEASNFHFASSNKVIGDKTLDLMLGFYLPSPLFKIGRPFALALMDEPLLKAMGLQKPPAWARATVNAALRFRAHVMRLLPKRRKPHLLTRVRRPTYPNGYAVEALGTFAPGAEPPPTGRVA